MVYSGNLAEIVKTTDYKTQLLWHENVVTGIYHFSSFITQIELYKRKPPNFILIWSSSDVCRTLAFIPPIEGHALVNHVIRNITLDRQHTCQVECYLDNHCLSFNFGHNQDGEPICELSDSDHRQHPEDLWIRERFTYVGTEVR